MPTPLENKGGNGLHLRQFPLYVALLRKYLNRAVSRGWGAKDTIAPLFEMRL
ncbi:hypothetical protein [Shimia isoporae]|uniref:hypothetical protein n=1 Tax=Shimia isoporae TaxID=647720 RepID=UPI0014048BA8|nr:hypothetical protein [Shimia isoporae]